MLRHNDWMTYSFDGNIPGQKTEKNQKLSLHVNLDGVLKLPYIDSLFRNASIIQDTFNLPQDVLLSGGTDSEIIVRVNHALGIKQNLYTFRLEDNLNYRDVEAAIKLANELNLKLNLIDFNCKRFVEQEAESFYKKTFMSLSYGIRNKWIDYLDNLPVFGNGEQYWARVLGADYDQKSDWRHFFREADFDNGLYGILINRPVIGEWYLFTPEPLFNYHKHPVIASLLNDEVYGKTSTWSSRHLLFKDLWPTFEHKQKLVGYEESLRPGSRPSYFDDFENKIMEGFEHKYIFIAMEDFDTMVKQKMTFTSVNHDT